MIIRNFQSESKKSGNEFEDLVEQDLKSRQATIVGKDFNVKDIGIELDYIADYPNKTEWVEAKGGKKGGKKRPGAERTDNVKKAIANGALLKVKHPDAFYVIYFSAPPKPGSYSDRMIETALEAGYVNEVRFL